jgi:hypothetical protein
MSEQASCAHEQRFIIPNARVEVYAPSPANHGVPTGADLRVQLEICNRCGHLEWRADLDWLRANAEDLSARLV